MNSRKFHLPQTPSRKLIFLLHTIGVTLDGETKTELRIEPRLLLAFGALVFAVSNRSLHILGEALHWSPSYVTVLLAYGFVQLVKEKDFAVDVSLLVGERLDRVRMNRFVTLIPLIATSCVAFLINGIVMSANATCVVVAPLFVPLLEARGIPTQNAVAAVLVGAWGGFLNSADIGAQAIKDALGQPNYPITAVHLLPALCAFAVAALLVAIQGARYSSSLPTEVSGGNSDSLVPMQDDPDDSVDEMQKKHRHERWMRMFLFALPFVLFAVIEAGFWFLEQVSTLRLREICPAEYRLAGYMFLGVLVAVYANPRPLDKRSTKAREKSRLCFRGDAQWLRRNAVAFLEGSWSGFIEVVVLILCSRAFIKGGLYPWRDTEFNGNSWISLLMIPGMIVLTYAIGSGDATSTTGIRAMISNNKHTAIVPRDAFASMIWLSCELGRCCSPVAPAVLTTIRAGKAHLEPRSIARSLAVPMLTALCIGCAGLYVIGRIRN